MTLLITGAGGYLGRALVAAARARGHAVRALTRGAPPAGWAGDSGIESWQADLSEKVPQAAFAGIDALIHAAARMGGDDADHGRETVAPTGPVLEAAARAGARLVLVSSMAVPGTTGLAPMAVVDETTPPDPDPALRDAYARAKLAQERIAREVAARHGAPLRIVRPGAIFGPGRVWNAHLGPTLGRLVIGPRHAGELPLCWRPHAAQALLLAAETPQAPGVEVIHALDDDRPDRARYLAALGRPGLPLPWRALDLGAAALAPVAPRLPGLLRRPTLRARLMPLRYANARLHALGWRAEAGFEAAMAAALSGRDVA
ncbi:NAD-dependent epimerase/dehydratase family protein [Limimaricola pyoseonensis]|uniref:NAD dependent epimerase/dehydratase family protein n=1 Tax=Limimaricola pyoseonensis TaxID=521013 RepID=A0A1G7K1V0_9RHOB|nr:NAD-dependent epimerase/dehydratase family protein [Limimaricola pyoseonensis]SDF31107.1 NAD dependent epimerase/dehydratase family protein [Limimaricola pyoseonensis]